MNTTDRKMRMLAEDIMDYVNKKTDERLREIKIDIVKDLKKQQEEILIGVNKIVERCYLTSLQKKGR